MTTQSNGDIVFSFRGKKDEIIKHDLPKSLLYFLLKQLKRDSQYSGGKLFVKLYEDKKEIDPDIKIDSYTKFLQNT